MNRKKMINNAKVCIGGVVSWNNKLLVMFKPKKDWWEFPGGKLEQGESPEQGTAREVLEETGLKLTVDRLDGLFSFNSKNNTMIYLKFRMNGLYSDKEPNVILSKEHSEYKWMYPSTIVKTLKDKVSPMLLKYLTRKEVGFINEILIN